MKFVKEKDRNFKDIIVAVIVLLILVVGLLSLFSGKPDSKELKKEEPKKEVKVAEKPVITEEAAKDIKCANSSCSLDCKDGLCECVYTNPDTKTEEVIYCEMWK